MERLWWHFLGLERLFESDVQGWSIRWSRLETPFQALLLVLAFGAACYAVWWFYRNEPAYCSRPRKRLLAVLRSLAFLVLLVVLAGPVLELTKAGALRGKVLILVDVSQSMGRQERFTQPADKLVAARALGLIGMAEPASEEWPAAIEERLILASRLDQVRSLLHHPEIALLSRLESEYEVEVWTFSRATDIRNLSAERTAGPTVLDDIQPDGVATELGNVLREVARRTKGQSLAGVILFTDGGNNRGEDPISAAEEFPARLYPVGIGVPQARDISIGSIFLESKLFRDDAAPLYVRLRQRGFAGQRCQILVTLGGEEVARQPVTLGEDGEQTEVVRLRPKRPGRFPVRVEVEPVSGESEPGNNAREKEVEILDGKLNVLLVEGEPRWEFRYLLNSLRRDRRVDVRALLRVPDLPRLAAGDPVFLREFPHKEKLFRFDVLIFGNLPNDAFWTAEDLENIHRFVAAEGGGIWLIAGRNHLPDAYKASPLEWLIPVEFERQPEVGPADEMRSTADGFRPVLTPEGRLHPLMRLDGGAGTEEENAGRWELVPDFHWYHKAVRPKLGATALLVHGGRRDEASPSRRGGPSPILVVSQIGRGRVLYSAVEEFWRLRFPIELGPDALDRFHAQAVQYLGLRHAMGGSPRVEITTDGDEFALGDAMVVTARVLDPETYEPRIAERIPAELLRVGDNSLVQSFELLPVPQQPGIYRSSISPPEEGLYRFTIQSEDAAAYKDVRVRVPRLESEAPEMKFELLEKLAKATRPPGTGGTARAYLADQMGAIPDEIRAARRRLVSRVEDPLWDAPALLVLFVLFCGTEWLLRKWSDLC
jgi:hypothetical protein